MSIATSALAKIKESVHNLEVFKEIANQTEGYPTKIPFDFFLQHYNPLIEGIPKNGINWALNEEVYTDEYTSPCAFLYVIQKLSGQQFFSVEELTKACLLVDKKFDLQKNGAAELLKLAYHSGREENLRVSYEYMCEIGCQYQDLLKVDREWFGLPECWTDDCGDEVVVKEVLKKAIAFGLDLEQKKKFEIRQKAKKFGVSSKFLIKIEEEMFGFPIKE